MWSDDPERHLTLIFAGIFIGILAVGAVTLSALRIADLVVMYVPASLL